MFIPRCLFAIILLICTASKFLFAEHANHTWEKSYKSVVNVLPTWPGYERPGFGAPKDIAPAGTGFYFELNDDEELSQYILTALHVIKNAKKVEITDYFGNRDNVKIIYKDVKTDIAILKSKIKKKPIKFSNSKLLIGNHVCTIGNTFGLGISMSCGIISALERKNLKFNEIENFIQIDAAVNPGDSGAPLIDSDGQLIGMVDAIYTKEADIDAGVNFAIDKKLIKKILSKFKFN